MTAPASGSSATGDHVLTEQERGLLTSMAVLGEHGVVWIADQLVGGGPYTAWYPAPTSEGPRLRVTLHTDSLEHAADEDLRVRDWLVELGAHAARWKDRNADVEVQITPFRGGSVPMWAAKLPVLGSHTRSRFIEGPFADSLRADWDQVRLAHQPPAGVLDLRLHEYESRDVFVTIDETVLDLGLMPERKKKSFVVKPPLAERYVDLFLRTHGEFLVLPNVRVNRGLYYWMRLWTLVPAFQSAWPYAVFGRDVVPRSREIHDFMHALYARLMGMMQAYDRIGWLRYSPRTNDTRDEMLNQLNYFIVLATGVFDSIAWLALHRFQVPLKTRAERKIITVRANARSDKQHPFFAKLAAAAPDLEAYLADADRQARIAVFYEPRDSIQHRLVLTGAHFNTGQYLSDCNVVFPDQETVQAILAVDHHEPALTPFSVWGLVYAYEEEPLLEPYRFTGTALDFVLSFVQGALERLDLTAWLSPYPNMKAAADAAIDEGRVRNCPAFTTPFP